MSPTNRRRVALLATLYWLGLLATPYLPLWHLQQAIEQMPCGAADGCIQHVAPAGGWMAIGIAWLCALLWPACIIRIIVNVRQLRRPDAPETPSAGRSI